MDEQRSPNPEKYEEYIEINREILPNGKTITFYCRKEGPSLDEVMAKVYHIAADSLRRKMGL